MARSATTLDVFSAIAEPKRRRMIELLASEERPVNDMAALLDWPQPMVSKHLGVLKQVGIVSVRENGRQRFYRLNGERLKPIHDWTSMFEEFWTRQLDGIARRAERKAKEQRKRPSKEH